MARLKGAVCRTCRVEGAKLFLKGDRCYSTKCSFSKREYAPGMHGAKKRRQRPSNYRVQLREKQKLRKTYGVMEKQFRKYYDKASAMGGVTGTSMLQLLESRLDNLVYRLGFAQSRAQARQMVRHGHILVNDKKLSIPSCHIKIGQSVAVNEKSTYFKAAKELISVATSRGAIPEWTTVDEEKVAGSLTALPTREQMPQDIQENLIVEYYSR
jgi:small subunit ribosomal protein S4